MTARTLTGAAKRLDDPVEDLVEDDVFRASVELLGSYDFDTQIGGEPSAPHLWVLSIKVIRGPCPVSGKINPSE